MNYKAFFTFLSTLNLYGMESLPQVSVNTNSNQPANMEIVEKKLNKREQKLEKKLARQQQAEIDQQLEDFANRDKLSFASQETLPTLTISSAPAAEETKKVSFFCFPLIFTDDGFESFFNHSFNRDEYGKEFLPHNFGHLGQIIRYSQSHGLSREFLEGAIRLFHQKLKSAPYVSAPALEFFLNDNIPYLELQLAQQEFSLWTEIKETLIDRFKAQFNFLQENPLGFFDYVAKELDEKVNYHVISPERARATLVRFLNSSLDKVIWSPDDQEQTWESFKNMGRALEYLHKVQVIPDSFDINDLYWSLVERYCYFLDLVGTKLNLETCQLMKRDLAEHALPWLLTSEQEKGITTKLEKLAKAVLETEARIAAKNNGIFTEKYLFPRQN